MWLRVMLFRVSGVLELTAFAFLCFSPGFGGLRMVYSLMVGSSTEDITWVPLQIL